MIRRSSPTAVHAGVWPANIGERPLFVVDAGVEFDAPGAVRLDPSDTGLDAVRSLASRLGEHDTVVGVGGGSVLDMVKLACLVDSDPGSADVLEVWGSRAGLIALPQACTPVRRRVLVPTTIGSGAEVSPVACVTIGDQKRLVTGVRLQPEIAVLDPRRTATLPPRLLREGVLEALLRIIGPVVGSAEVGGLPDAEAAMLVRELVAVGDRFAAGDTGADARLRAAMLSAATHTGWALVGRETFSAKHWYLANELSTTLGVRKMEATVFLLPAVWERIMLGDNRFGSAARLVTAWRWIADSPPVSGLRDLIRRWDVGPCLVPAVDAFDAAATKAVRSWGGRLPMLAGIDRADIEDVYREGARCST